MRVNSDFIVLKNVLYMYIYNMTKKQILKHALKIEKKNCFI